MDKYFYLDTSDQQLGPVSPEMFASLGINANTMVWKKGMPKWIKASQIPELAMFIGNQADSYIPPQLQPPSQPRKPFENTGGVSTHQKPPVPDNNIVWGVLVTVFCCLPLGIYSIIQGSKVSGLYASGKYAEAKAMSEEAKIWAIWGA